MAQLTFTSHNDSVFIYSRLLDKWKMRRASADTAGPSTDNNDIKKKKKIL